MLIDSYKLTKFTVVYFLIEPLLSLLLFNVTGGASFFSGGFHATKDLLLLSLLSVAIYHFVIYSNFYKDLVDLYIVLFFLILIIAVNWLISEASFNFLLLNSRRILISFLIFFVFSSLIYKDEDILKLKKFFYKITILVCSYGILEFFLPLSFWDHVLNIPEYWNASDNLGITSIRQVGRGYTSDLIFLTGEKFKRMLSFFLEPTTLGTFLALSYAYFLFAENIRRRSYLLLIIFISGFLCFSKIFLICAILTTLLKKFRFKLSQLYILTFLFFLLMGFFLHGKPKAHGALSHVIGLYSGFEIALKNWHGMGLGMAGNRMETPEPSIMNGELGGESGIGNIWAQIGFVGSVVLFFVLKLHKTLKKLYNKTKNEDYYALSVMLFVYFINLLLSASSLSLKGNFILFIIVGVYISRKKEVIN